MIGNRLTGKRLRGTAPQRALLGVLAAAGLTLGGAGAASAQSCADQVERFAADHSLSTTPPPTAAPGLSGSTGGAPSAGSASDGGGSGAAASEKLARSGGVVAPPAVGDSAVIEPPRAGTGNMPTAPALKPDAGPGGGSGPGTSGSSGAMGQAAQNAQLDSLVTAARSAAKRGDEAQCMESLTQARRLTQTTPGGTGGGG